MPAFALRTTVYSLILTFSLAEIVLGITVAFMNTDLVDWRTDLSAQTALVGGIIAFPVLLTSIALLIFNNRPYSSKLMARASFHLCANIFISVLSLASAALLSSRLGVLDCGYVKPLRDYESGFCGLRISPSVLGWLSFIMSTVMVILLCREGRLHDNVAVRADLHRKVAEPAV